MTPDGGNWIVTPIGDGVVEEFGENRIFGKYVLIKHSERVYSFYAHLDKIYYAGTTGAVVTEDTAIGIMGNTGYSDNSHLHYELRIWTGKDMERINGLPFMNRGNNG
ncbi:MAG: M23 family metallopeptidase [Mycoplasma sp.]|nr:M23 family metallopeptidase [Mycoplasma sp.]